MRFSYTARKFPTKYGTRLRGTKSLDFSLEELLWSAISVGRANLIDVLSHGIYSEYEILYRTSIIVANIATTGKDLEIVRSNAYDHLDPSEKGAISYFLGLTFSKLIAAKILETPWLMHIDVYREQFAQGGHALKFRSSRVRPDLIGLNSNSKWLTRCSKLSKSMFNLILGFFIYELVDVL